MLITKMYLSVQEQVEQRLKRIHDRQEAARKLAHNVEILLQQRSLVGAGRGTSPNTPQMTSSELLATAQHVAKDFRTLTSQMKRDFAVDDKNNNLSMKGPASHGKTPSQVKTPSCIKTLEKHSAVESSINDNNRGVAFTVGFDDDKQLLSPVPKALQVSNKTCKSRLTVQELEEKQIKAEERRKVSQGTKLVQVNRLALFDNSTYSLPIASVQFNLEPFVFKEDEVGNIDKF